MSQFDSWTIKRHVSPDINRLNTQNLNKMQENLSAAAHTIEALKLERDRLKNSMKFPLEQSTSHLAPSSPELEELLNLLRSKEKTIEKLESQLISEKIKKADLNTMTENFSKLRSELSDKEKHIIGLEKVIRELKTALHSQISLSEMSDSKEGEKWLGGLKREVEELRQEKKQWGRVKEVLQGVVGEFSRTASAWQRGRGEWELIFEALENMKNSLQEKEGIIKELMIENKHVRHANEAQLSYNNKNKSERSGMMFGLTEACSRFIQAVHLRQCTYNLFQTHFKSSSFLKELIEKKEFSEALLKFLLFVNDLLKTDPTKDKSVSIESKNSSSYYSESARFGGIDKEIVEKPRYFSPSFKDPPQTVWTQTKIKEEKRILSTSKSTKGLQTSYESVNRESRPLPKSKVSETASKKVQTVAPQPEDSQKPAKTPQSPKRSLKNAETSTTRPEVPKTLSESQAKDQGYIKLFDESDQLLTIIDKQHLRLAKINNQISHLVPETLEADDESSSDSESPKAPDSYLASYPQRIKYEGGSFNKRDAFNGAERQVDEAKALNRQGGCERNEKIGVKSPKSEVKYPEMKVGSQAEFEAYSGKTRTPRGEYRVIENFIEDRRDLHSSNEDYEEESDKSESRHVGFENEDKTDEFNRYYDASSPGGKLGISSKFTYLYKNEKKTPSKRLRDPQDKDTKEDHWNSVVDYFSTKGDESQ